jgi:tRNA threonylcarbamoyl adenosine modification protein YeaZ
VLLALDTATATASVAAYDLDADALLGETTWIARRRQTQDLLAAAHCLLDRVGRAPAQITALAATTGPGSFTGVRIALSALKGIGLGLAQPPHVIGLPTLAVTAAPWLAVAGSIQPAAQLCAYLQAGRGRYNWVLFDSGDELRRPTAADHYAGAAADFAAALATADRPVWLVGEPAADLIAALALLPHVTLVDAVAGLRRAGVLARLAARHLAAGHADDLAALQPLYLQEP